MFAMSTNIQLIVLSAGPEPNTLADVLRARSQTGGQPRGPPGERLTQRFGSGAGRRDDEHLIVVTDPAGTATRPPRAQAGQPHLVERVDDLPDHVLVTLHQPGDRRHRVPAGR